MTRRRPDAGAEGEWSSATKVNEKNGYLSSRTRRKAAKRFK